MFEYQSPSEVHRPIVNRGAIRATGRTDVLLYLNLSLIKPDLAMSSHMLFLIFKATLCVWIIVYGILSSFRKQYLLILLGKF